MLLRFQTEGVSNVEFELYGAAGESVAGVYDAIRSAVLDLTADAVVLKKNSLACLEALQATVADGSAERDSEKAKLAALVAQIKQAVAYAEQATELYLVDGKSQVLFCKFEAGVLRKVAEKEANFITGWAKGFNEAFAVTPAALFCLQGLDAEYDPTVMPKATPVLRIALPVTAAVDAGDDLDALEETAPKASKRRRA